MNRRAGSKDRNALSKDLTITGILAARADEARRAGEALIREADNLACQCWNERMWSNGGPVNPSPTIDQAINGGFPWLEIRCSGCKTPRYVHLCAQACAYHLRARSGIAPDLPEVRRRRQAAGRRAIAALAAPEAHVD